MMQKWSNAVAVAVAAVWWAGNAQPCRSAEPPIDFSRHVQPILADNCYACHGPDEAAREADLRLDVRDAATAARADGRPAIAPGAPDSSAILDRITSQDPDLRMPPASTNRQLTENEISILRQWIQQGATYEVHWSYRAPERPKLPEVSDAAWPANAIDHFVLARLDVENLSPAPEAARHTLLRRVALDLTGLPPSDEAIEAFDSDTSDHAFERAVDRLLASPAYGERWASVWLDLARYGDSAGYTHDPPRTIWRWRDWLIQALNRNLPFDQFTREMIAGDLLPDATTEQRIATGFHRNTTTNTEGGASAKEYHFAAVVDRVNTTMQVWMGSTFACAQCHNHKYDPFTQREYYQLLSFFNNTEDFNTEEPSLQVPRVGQQAEFASLSSQLERAQRELEAESRRVDALQPAWEQSVDREQLPDEIKTAIMTDAASRSADETAKLQAHHRSLDDAWKGSQQNVDRLRAELDRVAATTLVMRESSPRATHIAIRGDVHMAGEQVSAGVPAALHSMPEGAPLNRLGLADWLTDSRNPLTARVAVNRLWQEIFGIGIVETSEEFGLQGTPASHPELLDWLATEYMRCGWDTKYMLRLIVLSSTYRQSSEADESLTSVDPYNRLLARGPRIRLSAEALRDQSLAAARLLSGKMYGPPVQPFQPVNGLSAAFGSSTDWTTSPGEDAYRRALYTRWRRNLPYPSMIAFDVPERAVCSVRRLRTNTPVQALVTLNDPVFVDAARALARRIRKVGGSSAASRAQSALEWVLRRPASQDECQRVVSLYESSRASLAHKSQEAAALAGSIDPVPADPEEMLEVAAWTVVGNVLLNLDEALVPR